MEWTGYIGSWVHSGYIASVKCQTVKPLDIDCQPNTFHDAFWGGGNFEVL